MQVMERACGHARAHGERLAVEGTRGMMVDQALKGPVMYTNDQADQDGEWSKDLVVE